MIPVERFRTLFPRATAMVEPHLDMLRKAVSFALIGVVNVLIDYDCFLARLFVHQRHAVRRCGRSTHLPRPVECVSNKSIVLIAANTMSWLVAVTCSYVMNSHITFAAESGRQLRWKSYGTFLASGVLGAIVNTTTLVIAARFMPVLAAKGIAHPGRLRGQFHHVAFRGFSHPPHGSGGPRVTMQSRRSTEPIGSAR